MGFTFAEREHKLKGYKKPIKALKINFVLWTKVAQFMMCKILESFPNNTLYRGAMVNLRQARPNILPPIFLAGFFS